MLSIPYIKTVLQRRCKRYGRVRYVSSSVKLMSLLKVDTTLQVVKLDLSASNSLSGVVSTLIPLSSFCGCVVLCFLFLRWRVKPLYRPRPHLGLQQPTPPASIIRSIFSSEADYIVLKDQSLDAYLFLRFVRWLIRIALYGCAITWPILLPVNATGGGRTSQFDTLAVTNVRSPTRFYGHVACAGLFYGEYTWCKLKCSNG